MKTDDLVALLATGVAPVQPHAARRHIGQALLVGLPVSVAILFAGYGVRDDLATAMLLPMFWVKLLFPLCIAAAALVTLHRLGRPGVRTGWTWMGLLLPILAVWALALGHKLTGFLVDQIPVMQGASWLACVMSIVLISLPVLVATLRALRELAPTRPALTGAAAGALAGGVAAAVFALHCKELAPASLAIWHLIGMAIPTLAGALLGWRLLRW